MSALEALIRFGDGLGWGVGRRRLRASEAPISGGGGDEIKQTSSQRRNRNRATSESCGERSGDGLGRHDGNNGGVLAAVMATDFKGDPLEDHDELIELVTSSEHSVHNISLPSLPWRSTAVKKMLTEEDIAHITCKYISDGQGVALPDEVQQEIPFRVIYRWIFQFHQVRTHLSRTFTAISSCLDHQVDRLRCIEDHMLPYI
ncbi:hypothetical protein Scep_023905 [Stephania cephalantha]|uniref:Uncharacterized protein n=1 Tax=Stephania cephalantha TaxID=152367 RepID=A0AAP0EYB4_9MAGN